MSKKSDVRKRLLNGTNAKSQYEVQKASNERYLAKQDNIVTRVPKGERDLWKSYATQKGKSLNAFITELVHNEMDKDGFDYSISEQSLEKSE